LEVGIDIGSMGALLFTKFETLSWQLTWFAQTPFCTLGTLVDLPW
jgi:hypothetical protein